MEVEIVVVIDGVKKIIKIDDEDEMTTPLLDIMIFHGISLTKNSPESGRDFPMDMSTLPESYFQEKKEYKKSHLMDIPEKKKYKRSLSIGTQDTQDTPEEKKLTTDESVVKKKYKRAPPTGRPCIRSLKTGLNKGKKCNAKSRRYGLCDYHWGKWRKANPWLNHPGYYK